VKKEFSMDENEDSLKESWVYQEIFQRGVELGREIVRKNLRQAIVLIVKERFPVLEALTAHQVEHLTDSGVLSTLLISIASTQNLEDAMKFLTDSVKA
jgi:predicted transposase YdaD